MTDAVRIREQGQAQFDSIVGALNTLDTLRELEGTEGNCAVLVPVVERAIREDALSVEVRSDWHLPGEETQHGNKPVEYRILLNRIHPTVRIIGRLSEHGEPETAHLEVQDWFTPWVEFRPLSKGGAEGILLTYARCFWFGE